MNDLVVQDNVKDVMRIYNPNTLLMNNRNYISYDTKKRRLLVMDSYYRLKGIKILYKTYWGEEDEYTHYPNETYNILIRKDSYKGVPDKYIPVQRFESIKADYWVIDRDIKRKNRNRRTITQDIEISYIEFSEQFISYCVQRNILKDIIPVFQLFATQNGIPLEQYLTNWAKRLLNTEISFKDKQIE
jgi:hypothetical protein